MSLFRPVTLTCPACAAPVDFQAVGSVNADRRPDLRAAIIDGSFQREACPQCGTSFRLDPEFNLLDVGRGQWIAVYPVGKLANWNIVEQDVQRTYDRAYGRNASPLAQEIGDTLQVRLTFGWSAVREKLIAAEAGIDDVALELLKVTLVSHTENVSIVDDNELRLVELGEELWTMVWLRSDTEKVLETLRFPRTLYDELAADQSAAWQSLREQLTAGLFVDMQRLMIEPARSPA